MDTRSTAALSETEIRNTLEAWAEAIRFRDVERIFSCYHRISSPSMPLRSCSSRAATPTESTGKPA